MKVIWEKYAALYNARIIRERVIIALCVVAALYLIWDLLALSGLREKRKDLNVRYETANAEITKQLAEKRILSQALLNNPNAQKQREIAQLTARLTELDKKIEDLSVGLVSAEKLPRALREVLSNTDGLELLGMVAHPPETLRLAAPAELSEEDEERLDSESEAGVYKHRVVFRLAGRYFAIRDYLSALESSDWHFYWSSLDYVVEQYPKAIVQLEVYTLSTDKGFMGE